MARAQANAILRCIQPDYEEQRAGSHLLVWRDLAHWTIVDTELREAISLFDGRRTLREIVGSDGNAQTAILPLIEAGVLVDIDGPLPSAAPREAPLIRNIALNLTRRCNLRCRFCYNLDKLAHDDADELSAREILGVLKSAKPFAAKRASLVILGGEPLIDERKLLDVTTGALRIGYVPLVSTNGTLVSDEFARWARRFRLQVQVSLDGHNAEANDAVRGEGSFDRAVGGIRSLVRAGAYTIVSMVCHAGLLGELESFYDFCADLGVDEARFIPLKTLGGAANSGFEAASITDMIKEAYSLLQRRPDLPRMMGRDAFTILGNSCRFRSARCSCGTGSETFLLDSDGLVYPCLNTNMPEFRVADAREPGFDFRRMWHESAVLGNIRRASSINEASSECFECLVKHWCLGSCHGETYAVNGDMSKRSPHCADSRRAIIEMFWILAERPDLVKQSEIIC